ncbi:MAG: class I SAM-dependent methyltransferase [Betaproteobacteria bacterium]
MLTASWLGWPAGLALLLGTVPALWFQAWVLPGWRRWLVLGGLPVLMLTTAGVSSVGPGGWLALALLLLVVYPLQAWRDAPVFPTPPEALRGLGEAVTLAPGAAVLDAGSGLGHGMVALRQAFPLASVQGVESSLLLVMLSRWRLRRECRRNPDSNRDSNADSNPDLESSSRSSAFGPSIAAQRVLRGDMWAMSWARFDLVYLFQRPESMRRAWDKACSELAPGTCLVSLEFEVPGVPPTSRLTCPDGRILWIYRLGAQRDSVASLFGR